MQARTEEYARLLRIFSRAELEEAYRDVLQTWDHSAWPPPGRFYTAAMENRKTAVKPRCDLSEREAAAADYLRDGTAWGPGMNMPYKALIAARVAGLESAGLPKGKREGLPASWAEGKAREIMKAQA